MIDLPDFSKCVEFIRLKEKMGVTVIPVLPIVKFTKEIKVVREIEKPNTKVVELENKLSFSSVSVDLIEISVDNRGLLDFNGFKVVAYIRDQLRGVDIANKVSSYRYHLCDCRTLKKMREIGRQGRYLTTKRKDGLFEVYDTSYNQSVKVIVKMELCKNCIEELKERNLWIDPFSLEKFFKKYDSIVPKTIKRIETATVVQNYSPNQDDISREYKIAAEYRCQKCNVECISFPNLLHLHHKNGNRADNSHENLRVLCIDCHSKEAMHEYMVNPQIAKTQVEKIKQLRKAQGITDLGISI